MRNQVLRQRTVPKYWSPVENCRRNNPMWVIILSANPRFLSSAAFLDWSTPLSVCPSVLQSIWTYLLRCSQRNICTSNPVLCFRLTCTGLLNNTSLKFNAARVPGCCNFVILFDETSSGRVLWITLILILHLLGPFNHQYLRIRRMELEVFTGRGAFLHQEHHNGNESCEQR